MKVILLEDVKGKGKIHDVIDVADGYAKNYLIKEGLALAANSSNLAKLTKILAIEKTELETKQKDYFLLKQQLENIQLNFKLQVNHDQISGSVSLTQIVDRLAKEYDIKLDKKKFVSHTNLTKIGLNYLDIKLSSDVTARIKIMIEKKEH